MTSRTWLRAGLAMFGVGWGANQFAPLLLVYRSGARVSEVEAAAMFGVYALGLIPSLVLAGRFSDVHGRRGMLRVAVVLSVVASVVLISGAAAPEMLYIGRFLAGVSSGVAFSAGSAWIKELSALAPPGAGARRATLSLSGGFGGGPLVAGMVAQWAPLPDVLPYFAHVALMAIVIPLVWNAPDPFLREIARGGAGRRAFLPQVARSGQFVWGVAAWAPWVFGTATIGFAVLPGLVAERVAGMPVAFNAAITGLTLFTGVLVQPVARRVGHKGKVRQRLVGLGVATAGLSLAAVVAIERSPWLVAAAALLLGASYGILLVSGLHEVERLAPQHELASLVAIFYACIYIGFSAPYVLAVLAPHLSYQACLLLAALCTFLSTILVLTTAGRTVPTPEKVQQAARAIR